MAYASAYFLNWLAAQVAGQALTVKLHTGAPGNAGHRQLRQEQQQPGGRRADGDRGERHHRHRRAVRQ